MSVEGNSHSLSKVGNVVEFGTSNWQTIGANLNSLKLPQGKEIMREVPKKVTTYSSNDDDDDESNPDLRLIDAENRSENDFPIEQRS